MLFVEYCILFKFHNGLNNVFAFLIFILFRIFPRIIPKLCRFHVVFDSYNHSFPRGSINFENHKKHKKKNLKYFYQISKFHSYSHAVFYFILIKIQFNQLKI